jgi:hypothetical protein
MTPEERRLHLMRLLDTLESAPPPPKRRIPKGEETVRIPVYKDGRVIGYVEEPTEDHIADEHLMHLHSVRQLRLAVEDGTDPYLIAWLALQVGGGTALPYVITVQNNQVLLTDNGRNSRKLDPAEVYELIEAKLEARRRSGRRPSIRGAADIVAREYEARGVEVDADHLRKIHREQKKNAKNPLK